MNLIKRLTMFSMAALTLLGGAVILCEGDAAAAPKIHAGKKRLFAPLRAAHLPDQHSAELGRFQSQSKPDVRSLFKALADASADSSGRVTKTSELHQHLRFATEKAKVHWTTLVGTRTQTKGEPGHYGTPERVVEAGDLAVSLWAESRRIAQGDRLNFGSESKNNLSASTSASRGRLETVLGRFSEGWVAAETPLAPKERREAYRRALVAYAKVGLDPWKRKNLQRKVEVLDTFMLRAVEMNAKAWSAATTFAERGEIFGETSELLASLRSVDGRYTELLQQRADAEMERLVNDGVREADAFLKADGQKGYEREADYLKRMLPALQAICRAAPSAKRNTLALAFESTLVAMTRTANLPDDKQLQGAYQLVADIHSRLSSVAETAPAGIKRVVGELRAQTIHQLRAQRAAAVADVGLTVNHFLAAKPPVVVRDLGRGTYGDGFRPWLINGQRGDATALLKALAPHLDRRAAIRRSVDRARKLSETLTEMGIDAAAALTKVEAEEQKIAGFEPVFSLVSYDAKTSKAQMEHEVLFNIEKGSRYGSRNTWIWSAGYNTDISRSAYDRLDAAFSREKFNTIGQIETYVEQNFPETSSNLRRERSDVLSALYKARRRQDSLSVQVEADVRDVAGPTISAEGKGLVIAVARILAESKGRALSHEEIARRLPADVPTVNDIDSFRLLLDIEMPKVTALIKVSSSQAGQSYSVEAIEDPNGQEGQLSTLAYRVVAGPTP